MLPLHSSNSKDLVQLKYGDAGVMEITIILLGPAISTVTLHGNGMDTGTRVSSDDDYSVLGGSHTHSSPLPSPWTLLPRAGERLGSVISLEY